MKKQEGWLGHSEAAPQVLVFLGHRFAMPQPPTALQCTVRSEDRSISWPASWLAR